MAESAGRRIIITDTAVGRLPLAADERGYLVRDRKLSGFCVRVGKTRRTYRFEAERRRAGTREVTSKRLGEWPHTKADAARADALTLAAQLSRGETPQTAKEKARAADADTLAGAWDSYKALLKKKGRSERTIADYQQKVDDHLAEFHRTPLGSIKRGDVVRCHTELTRKVGPYAANGTMRVGHAVYNHAAKDLEMDGLPALNPFRGRNLFNEEEARDSGMGTREVRAWFDALIELKNPVMRELHWLTLLSGLRRGDVCGMRWTDVSILNRTVALPSPKGGKKRAFKIPLSKAMVRCLVRARIAGRLMHGQQSRKWVFPAASRSGHVQEIKGTSWTHKDENGVSRKQAKARIDRVGHALRHSFRTLAAAASVAKTRSRILMNHKVAKDVHDDYMNVPAMFDELRESQDAISALTVRAAGKDAEGRLAERLRQDLAPV